MRRKEERKEITDSLNNIIHKIDSRFDDSKGSPLILSEFQGII